MMRNPDNANYWALILGASSGFGEAASLKLAEDGYNILVFILTARLLWEM